MRISPLQPGLLVSLSVRMTGNVNYTKEIIEEEHTTGDGTREAEWKTRRVIADPEEHDRAVKVRSRAGSIVRGVCTKTSFGLLCLEAKADKLADAIADARRVADDFNAGAKLTWVQLYVIAGRVASDDVEAVRAINSEVRNLLADMEAGVRNLDPEKIREAAQAARGIGKMLSPEAQERLQTAIEAVRGAARNIVKAGETAKAEIDQSVLNRLSAARTAFLDLDSDGLPIESLPLTGRSIDLEPETQWPTEPPKIEEVKEEELPAILQDVDGDLAEIEGIARARESLDGMSNAALQPLVDAIKAKRDAFGRPLPRSLDLE